MFAKSEFIEASRKFVCIRIETFENKESEKMVRSLLNGAFANTAFCIFDPQGKERLSRSGRGPSSGLGNGRGRGSNTNVDEAVVANMKKIASRFKTNGKQEDTKLQDFNSFRQALNVASADQRLLVLVNTDMKSREKIEPTLQKVFADDEITGKFHLNFVNQGSDKSWYKVIQGAKNKPGIVIIHAGKFGLDGSAIAQLSLSEDGESIKSAMLDANNVFASKEDRKTYGSHVSSGRRAGIFFENEIPYGEDRDGDGKVDKKKRSGRRR